MSLIDCVKFPGPTGELMTTPQENLCTELVAVTRQAFVKKIMRWENPEDPSETAMATPPPTFLFARLPVEELAQPIFLCRGCVFSLVCTPLAVLLMVLLPFWPWTLLTFTVGWLVALTCVSLLWLWKNRHPVDSSELAS